MKDYLRQRMMVDAAHAIELAAQQAPLQHQGLKGRLREIVAQRLLRPWFPPFVGCGTGMIIHGMNDTARSSTQEDLIVFDRTLTPPILIEESSSEGIFLNNSVLARIEIKSRARAEEINRFAAADHEFRRLGFVEPFGVSPDHARRQLLCRSALLAFDSDTTGGNRNDKEIARFTQALDRNKPTAASALCVVGRGLWMQRWIGPDRSSWHRLKSDNRAEQLACFVSAMSDTIFHAHLERSGIDTTKAVGGGMGMYFPHSDEWEIDAAATNINQ